MKNVLVVHVPPVAKSVGLVLAALLSVRAITGELVLTMGNSVA